MKKHLNPLEKEFLIRQYFNNPDVSLKSFCEANNVSTSSFRKWRRLYSQYGIEGLSKDDKKLAPLLPPEVNPTLEMYKKEVLRLRIEVERFKKNYTEMQIVV
ncbi:helix-turn-helix domain-containing protein [Hallella bergensis]|uniref:transposase n=1 Tax=Hallella bergensis TaxID=242750 RepID=UPI0023F29BEF|nr:helix-turn-helix domain-containing protein [Hallella bergensis]